MYILLAIVLWLAGFWLSVYNYANKILVAIEPAAAHPAWQPSRRLPVFGLLRIATLLLLVAAFSVLSLTDSVSIYWVYFLLIAFFVVVISVFFSSVFAWRGIRRKYPRQVEEFRIRRVRMPVRQK